MRTTPRRQPYWPLCGRREHTLFHPDGTPTPAAINAGNRWLCQPCKAARRYRRQWCGKGLHRLYNPDGTPTQNIDVFGRGQSTACRPCRKAYAREYMAEHRSPVIPIMPRRIGYCKRNLHQLSHLRHNTKTTYITTKGSPVCRPCRRAQQKVRRARCLREGWGYVACPVRNCKRAILRRPEQQGTLYICPPHRREPPAWLVKYLRVIGHDPAKLLVA